MVTALRVVLPHGNHAQGVAYAVGQLGVVTRPKPAERRVEPERPRQ